MSLIKVTLHSLQVGGDGAIHARFYKEGKYTEGKKGKTGLIELGGLFDKKENVKDVDLKRRKAVRDFWQYWRSKFDTWTSSIPKTTAWQLNLQVKPDQSEEGMIAALKKTIRSQDTAIARISRIILARLKSVDDFHRPLSILMPGPSGYGKTALVEQIVQLLFGEKVWLNTEEREVIYLKVDMSNYTSREDISRLLGSSSGLIGSDEDGLLVQWLRRAEDIVALHGDLKSRPISAVLHIEELDKAHPEILTMLMELLDRGEIRSANGDRKLFVATRLLILMTANVAEHILLDPDAGSSSRLAKTMQQVRDTVLSTIANGQTSVLGRLGDIVPYFGFTAEAAQPVIGEITQRSCAELLTTAIFAGDPKWQQLNSVVIRPAPSFLAFLMLCAWEPATGTRSVQSWLGVHMAFRLMQVMTHMTSNQMWSDRLKRRVEVQGLDETKRVEPLEIFVRFSVADLDAKRFDKAVQKQLVKLKKDSFSLSIMDDDDAKTGEITEEDKKIGNVDDIFVSISMERLATAQPGEKRAFLIFQARSNTHNPFEPVSWQPDGIVAMFEWFGRVPDSVLKAPKEDKTSVTTTTVSSTSAKAEELKINTLAELQKFFNERQMRQKDIDKKIADLYEKEELKLEIPFAKYRAVHLKLLREAKSYAIPTSDLWNDDGAALIRAGDDWGTSTGADLHAMVTKFMAKLNERNDLLRIQAISAGILPPDKPEVKKSKKGKKGKDEKENKEGKDEKKSAELSDDGDGDEDGDTDESEDDEDEEEDSDDDDEKKKKTRKREKSPDILQASDDDKMKKTRKKGPAILWGSDPAAMERAIKAKRAAKKKLERAQKRAQQAEEDVNQVAEALTKAQSAASGAFTLPSASSPSKPAAVPPSRNLRSNSAKRQRTEEPKGSRFRIPVILSG